MAGIYDLIQNQEGISKIIPSFKYCPFDEERLLARLEFLQNHSEIAAELVYEDEEEDFYMGQQVQLITDRYEDDGFNENEIYFIIGEDEDAYLLGDMENSLDCGDYCQWVDKSEITGDY